MFYVPTKESYRRDSWSRFRNYLDDNTDVNVLLMNADDPKHVIDIIGDDRVNVILSKPHQGMVARCLLSKLSEGKYEYEYNIDDDLSLLNPVGMSSVLDYDLLMKPSQGPRIIMFKPKGIRQLSHISYPDENGLRIHDTPKVFHKPDGKMSVTTTYTMYGFLTNCGNIHKSMLAGVEYLYETDQYFSNWNQHDDSLIILGSSVLHDGGVYITNNKKLCENMTGNYIGTGASSTLSGQVSADGIIRVAPDSVKDAKNIEIRESLHKISNGDLNEFFD